MDNRRTSWSWVLPILFCLIVILQTAQYGMNWPDWLELFAWGTGFVFGLWGGVNFFLHVGYEMAWMRTVWDTSSPQAHLEQLAARLQSLDPRALKFLMQSNGGAWTVRPAADDVEHGPDYFLFGTRCHMEFIKFIIDHSTDDFLYPQRSLQDQTYDWDPIYREITDREQYREFENWLILMNWASWHHGNQSAKFINGWNPQRIAKRLDLEAFSYEEKSGSLSLSIPELK